MNLKIKEDVSLPDLSAEMRLSTFKSIPAVAQAKITEASHVAVSPDYHKAYKLNLVADEARDADTLYVSSLVAEMFYPGQTELPL